MAGSQASFSKDLGVVEESRADQGLTGNSEVAECAAHKDAFLTIGESAAPPPRLDPHSAVFLDVDGTLLEIAARPELVQVPGEVPMLIARVSEKREGALALISGRPLAELDRLFQPWRGAAAGLHGVERRRADGTLHRVHRERRRSGARSHPPEAGYAGAQRQPPDFRGQRRDGRSALPCGPRTRSGNPRLCRGAAA